MTRSEVVVWVPGARGLLGQAVGRCLDTAAVHWVGTDQELDIAAEQQVLGFARDHAVTHIVNCAAYTNVDGCESEQELAQRVNGHGPASLAQAACQVGAVALHVSTDYVFDGEAGRPYEETDPTGPVSAYGRSKLLGEEGFVAQMGRDAAQRWYVVRTSWLFGHGGKSFVSTMLRLMGERDEVAVVDDQHGRPTYGDDLARVIVDVLGVGGAARHEAGSVPAGIYHFANAGATTWFDFASTIRTLGLERGRALRCRAVRPIRTTDYPTPARRPAYSVLSTDKIARALGRAARPWQEALAEYLDVEIGG